MHIHLEKIIKKLIKIYIKSISNSIIFNTDLINKNNFKLVSNNLLNIYKINIYKNIQYKIQII
jgi:hypothetical protein